MYEVKSQTFSGPLDKLLELIEARHLEVTRLSLAEVTEDFLSYIKKLGEHAPPAEIADFLVVAARLLLIKSKVLLPELALTPDEESEIHDLEERLAIYRQFAARAARGNEEEGAGSRAILERWEKNVIHARALFAGFQETSIFYPPPALTKEHLMAAVSKTISALQEFLPQKSELKGAIISLEEKITELLNRFRVTLEHSFHTISKDRPRGEIVVMFLALLHLLKERSIFVTQKDSFGDIILRKTDK